MNHSGCAGKPADIVGSVFQRRSFVEVFEEDQPFSEFLISRSSKEPIRIVHAEVADDVFAAIT